MKFNKVFILVMITAILIGALLLISCDFNKEEGPIRVSYIVDDGLYKSFVVEDEIEFPQEPSRIGYVFDGWYIKGSGEKFTADTQLTKSIEVEAKWVAEQYTVTLDDKSGFKKTIIVSFDSPYGELDSITKEGYTFDGWYLNQVKIEPNTIVKMMCDHELNPKWIGNTYTLSFETNLPGISKDPIEVTYNSTYPSLPTLNKEGYSYKWILNGKRIRYGDTVDITKDSTAVAEWTADTYFLIYDSDGGDAVPRSEVTYGETYVGKLPNISKVGYSFNGWYLDGRKIEETTVVTTAITHRLKARWTANTYDLTLNYNDEATTSSTSSVQYDSNVTLPTPTRAGFTFVGWFNGLVNYSSGIWKTTSDMTLTAKWIHIENAEVNSLGKVVSFLYGEHPQTIKEENVTITEAVDSRGYYLGSDNEYYAKAIATPYNSSTIFSNGETVINYNVYYFKVEPIKWKVIYNDNDTYTVISDLILDIQKYHNSTSSREGATDYQGNSTIDTVYANNYKYSDIRTFLNRTFLNNAFTIDEQNNIQTTEVDNSVSSTGKSENPYACENTQDKIFLLSYSEATNTDYGFSSDAYSSSTRYAQGSDYAKAQGLYVYNGNSYWWLRSPINNLDMRIRGVNELGSIVDNSSSTRWGVRPALNLVL